MPQDRVCSKLCSSPLAGFALLAQQRGRESPKLLAFVLPPVGILARGTSSCLSGSQWAQEGGEAGTEGVGTRGRIWSRPTHSLPVAGHASVTKSGLLPRCSRTGRTRPREALEPVLLKLLPLHPLAPRARSRPQTRGVVQPSRDQASPPQDGRSRVPLCGLSVTRTIMLIHKNCILSDASLLKPLKKCLFAQTVHMKMT